MVPLRTEQEEDPYQFMLLNECPKRCSEHGLCIESECYCWLGYSEDYFQASKIADFYLGWRKKTVMHAYLISFFIGNNDEFRNMSEVLSQKIDDNEGKVDEILI